MLETLNLVNYGLRKQHELPQQLESYLKNFTNVFEADPQRCI